MNCTPWFRKSRLALAVGVAVSSGAFVAPAHADTFTVTIGTDTVDAMDSEMSFREAVTLANGNAGEDTIDFDPALDTIEIDTTGSNFIVIDDDTIIAGPGSGELTFMAPASGSTIYVSAFNQGSADVAVSGLTFTGEASDAQTGILASTSDPVQLSLDDVVFEQFTRSAVRVDFFGGGGALEVSDAVFRNNESSFRAPAIFAEADAITIRDSSFTGNTNTDTSSGGAVEIRASTTGEIIDSEFSGNETAGGGGGLTIMSTDGEVRIEGTTFSGNTAALGGGGIYWAPNANGTGSLLLVDTTISGNTTTDADLANDANAGSGGGLLVGDQTAAAYGLDMLQVTFSGNTAAGAGGGIFIGLRNDSADINIAASTITENSAAYAGGLIAITDGTTMSPAAPFLTHTVVAGNSVTTGPAEDVGFATGETGTEGGIVEAQWSFLDGVNVNTVATDSTVGGGDPGLGALGLAPYGDMKTEVHIPAEDSPLVDAGDPTLDTSDPDVPDNDQTGIERIVNGILDIGSVEFNPDPTPADEGSSGGGGGGGGGAIGGGLLGLLGGLLLLRRRLRR